MSTRPAAILDRFPRHVEAGGAGKRLRGLVEGLATPLDLLTAQVGDVRRSHRVRDAGTLPDLLALAALHDVTPADLVLPLRRADADGLDHDATLDLVRETLLRMLASHRAGNGSIGSLLGGVTAGLTLDLVDVTHAADRYVHVARCRDLLAPPDAPPTDVVVMEENPPSPRDAKPRPRTNGERFVVTRRGIEPVVTVTAVVRGLAGRTVAPMVVNVDEGAGVVFRGAVPDGDELRFGADGRVRLGDVDVTARAVGFRGAVFAAGDAKAAAAPGRDFTWAADDGTAVAPDGRVARFVETQPIPDGLAPDAPLPHGGEDVDGLPFTAGPTRWAFFIAEGRFDVDVFDLAAYAPPDLPRPPAAEVGLEWFEREAFAVRVWVPARFAALDPTPASDPLEPDVPERIRRLLDRHRAAGVHVSVRYADGTEPDTDPED